MIHGRLPAGDEQRVFRYVNPLLDPDMRTTRLVISRHIRWAPAEVHGDVRLVSDIDLPLYSGVRSDPPELREVDQELWIIASTQIVKTYNPMDVSDLHSKLARGDLTSEGALRLARRFGFVCMFGDSFLHDGDRVCGVSLSVFLYEVWRLRFFRDYYIALRDGDFGFLHTRRSLMRNAIAIEFNSISWYGQPAKHPSWDHCDNTDLEREAECLFSWGMSAALEDGALLLVQHERPGVLAFGVGGAGLMSAAYLQLALAIERGQGSRVCPECKQPFVLTKGDKVFCSDSCGSVSRQRTHNKKPRLRAGVDPDCSAAAVGA